MRWVQCDQCDDKWVCLKHPLGLQAHYNIDHEGEVAPGRSRKSALKRYMEEYIMDVDEE